MPPTYSLLITSVDGVTNAVYRVVVDGRLVVAPLSSHALRALLHDLSVATWSTPPCTCSECVVSRAPRLEAVP